MLYRLVMNPQSIDVDLQLLFTSVTTFSLQKRQGKTNCSFRNIEPSCLLPKNGNIRIFKKTVILDSVFYTGVRTSFVTNIFTKIVFLFITGIFLL
jgi:hypothetical protein